MMAFKQEAQCARVTLFVPLRRAASGFSDARDGASFPEMKGNKGSFELPANVYRPLTRRLAAQHLFVPGEMVKSQWAVLRSDEKFALPRRYRIPKHSGDPIPESGLMTLWMATGPWRNGPAFCETCSRDLRMASRCRMWRAIVWSSRWVGPETVFQRGTHLHPPDGTLLGKIHLPENVRNLWFWAPPQRERLVHYGTRSFNALLRREQRASRWPGGNSGAQPRAREMRIQWPLGLPQHNRRLYAGFPGAVPPPNRAITYLN